MKIKEQVLSIEQAKHLQEFGLDMSDAALCWAVGEMSFHDINVRHQSVVTMDSRPQQYSFIKEIIPTYTLQEVLHVLPKRCKIKNTRGVKESVDLSINWLSDEPSIWYEGIESVIKFSSSISLLQAAYYMLCWVLENGYYGK